MADDNAKQAPYDLFLSHSSADKPWVRPLCEALQREGLRVFLDESDIHAPENYVLTLNDALQTSRFFVLVATPRSAASGWVEQEWTSFMAEHGPVGRIIVVGYYGDDRVYGFTVETSRDGKTWDMVADKRDNKELSTVKGYTCTFNPKKVRYIKITQTSNSANTGRHLVEVMAYKK